MNELSFLLCMYASLFDFVYSCENASCEGYKTFSAERRKTGRTQEVPYFHSFDNFNLAIEPSFLQSYFFVQFVFFSLIERFRKCIYLSSAVEYSFPFRVLFFFSFHLQIIDLTYV